MSDKKKKLVEKDKPKHPSDSQLDGGRRVEINPRRYERYDNIITNPLISKGYKGKPPKIPGKKRKK